MKLSNLARRMILTILIIVSVCMLGSVIYYRSLDCLPFLLGGLLGTAVSIAKVFILERAVDKALAMEQKQAGIFVLVHHILRLVLTGGVLLLGALVPWLSLWGVAAGVLSFHGAVYSVKFTSKKD